MAGTDISHAPFTVIAVTARVVILAGCKLTKILLMAAHASRRQILWIRQSIREIISDFSVYDTEGRIMELDVAEGYKRRLEMLSREMLALQTSGELDFYESNALECLLKSYSIISEVVDKLERMEWSQPCQAHVSVVSDGNAGRPKFDISYSLLKTWICCSKYCWDFGSFH